MKNKHLKSWLLIFLIIINWTLPAYAWNKSDSSTVDPPDHKTFYKAVAFTGIYYTTAMLVLQNTWYNGRKIVPFHFYNDNAGYLQVDKLGHCYGAYFESYIGYRLLMNSGMPGKKALIYGGLQGLILQTPIEIMDGIHEGWGFSWGDMAANATGSALVIGQELLFHKQLIRYKFSYSESYYSRHSNNYLGKTKLDRLLKDYNGHTYWFSFPLNRIMLKSKIPSWVNIAMGYGANGMIGEYENITSYNGVEIPETTRYRQYILSLDINWTEIKTSSKVLKILFEGLNFIKVPFPALEYNSMGKFKGYWIYL